MIKIILDKLINNLSKEDLLNEREIQKFILTKLNFNDYEFIPGDNSHSKAIFLMNDLKKREQIDNPINDYERYKRNLNLYEEAFPKLKNEDQIKELTLDKIIKLLKDKFDYDNIDDIIQVLKDEFSDKNKKSKIQENNKLPW
jgi:hypothetical protein